MLLFHWQALTALLADDNKFGFIVMDGNGALFGTLSGNTREVLHKFTVDLPKKHGRLCSLLLILVLNSHLLNYEMAKFYYVFGGVIQCHLVISRLEQC